MNGDVRMLGLAKSARYALVGLVHLARRHAEGRVLAVDAARVLGLPPSYLAKLFQRLARKGLLEAHRGPHGGYALARSPEAITLAEVVKAMQDPREGRRDCLLEADACSGARLCALHQDVIAAERRVNDALSRVTLAQAARSNNGGIDAA